MNNLEKNLDIITRELKNFYGANKKDGTLMRCCDLNCEECEFDYLTETNDCVVPDKVFKEFLMREDMQITK